MKKIIGILTVLFVFMTTSFGQTHINDTEFNLTIDGVPSTEFVVTYSPQDQFNSYCPGVLIVYFDNPMESVDFQSEGVIDVNYITDLVYTEPKIKVGIKVLKIDYNLMEPGNVNMVAVSFPDDIYLTTDFHALDTLNSWNDAMEMGYYIGLEDGVQSVDTDSIFSSGVKSVVVEPVDTDSIFLSGLNSVVCEWSEQDTIDSYWNGFNSVDTMYYINLGATSVIKTEMTKSATISTSSQPEFVDIGLSVYPNPVSNGDYVNVNCVDFSHVDVYNMNGQKMFTSDDQSVPTYDLSAGIYVFHVWNYNGNLNSTKVIVQ